METKSPKRRWQKLILLALSTLVFCSCRFDLPDTREGQSLARAGAFPDQFPTWVVPPDDMETGTASNAGIMPRSYTATPAVKSSREAQPANKAGQPNFERTRMRQINAIERSESATAEKIEADTSAVNKADDSPLDRIEQTCPGTENSVSEALRTTDVNERIRKYNTLTKYCSNSSDIWFWLGKDYQSQGRYADAKRCFDKVLVLDPDNEAAKALLKIVNSKANAASQ